MLHFVSKNSATLDLKPLSNYKRTFRQLERKALSRQGGCFSTLEDPDRMARGLQEHELDMHSVLVFRQGSFTIACILFQGSPVSFGYAKRNVSVDTENPAKSENVAVHRAISNCFVDEIKDMSRPADSFVFAMHADTLTEEEMARFRDRATAPGEVFEVNRVKPAFLESINPKVVGRGHEVDAVDAATFLPRDVSEEDPTAFLPAASPFSSAPLHPDEFGGGDYPTEPHAVS